LNGIIVGEFAALGAALCWALAPLLYRQALFKTKPMSANIVRCLSNCIVLLLVLLGTGRLSALMKLPTESVILTIISGFIGLGIGDTLYMVALKHVGVSRAVPLASTYPLFSVLWATILLDQRLTLPILAGALAILLGILLLGRGKQEDTKIINGSFRKGILLSLATAFVWSVSITLMDIAITMSGSKSVDANFALITLRITSISILLLALVPAVDRNHDFLKTKRRNVLLLCLGGLVANGIGWFMMNISFASILEAQAVPISSTTPLFSAFAGFILFHEKLSRKSVLGAIVIVAGVALIFIV
jgi:drug/metabolite transporter, DME family